MATNNLAPTGFSFARNYISSAATFAQTQMVIANGYGTAIMVGDPVSIAANGTITAVSGTVTAPTNIAGIFAGVLPFYDTNLQAISHGLNGAYLPAAAPPSGVNIPCLVITDPFATFIAQLNNAGAAGFSQAWSGFNATWIASSLNSNTAGNGRSVAVLDGITNVPAVTAAFPFRIIGPAGVTGGPQDPANGNPWIEVRLNTAFALQPTGI